MPFYARFGFVPEGDEYLEAGIPHQTMVRLLRLTLTRALRRTAPTQP